jgi:hypothetical protein
MRRTRSAVALVTASCGLVGSWVSSASTPAAVSAAPSPPSATTGPPISVAQSSATTNGTVNPSGTAATYSFQYGTSTSYGENTPRGLCERGNRRYPGVSDAFGPGLEHDVPLPACSREQRGEDRRAPMRRSR